MKRIEYQLKRCIYDDVAYMPKLAGYPTLSDMNELGENGKFKRRCYHEKIDNVFR